MPGASDTSCSWVHLSIKMGRSWGCRSGGTAVMVVVLPMVAVENCWVPGAVLSTLRSLSCLIFMTRPRYHHFIEGSKVKKLDQGHTQWQWWDLSPGILILGLCVTLGDVFPACPSSLHCVLRSSWPDALPQRWSLAHSPTIPWTISLRFGLGNSAPFEAYGKSTFLDHFIWK